MAVTNGHRTFHKPTTAEYDDVVNRLINAMKERYRRRKRQNHQTEEKVGDALPLVNDNNLNLERGSDSEANGRTRESRSPSLLNVRRRIARSSRRRSTEEARSRSRRSDDNWRRSRSREQLAQRATKQPTDSRHRGDDIRWAYKSVRDEDDAGYRSRSHQNRCTNNTRKKRNTIYTSDTSGQDTP